MSQKALSATDLAIALATINASRAIALASIKAKGGNKTKSS
jgi:hypothetical protein